MSAFNSVEASSTAGQAVRPTWVAPAVTRMEAGAAEAAFDERRNDGPISYS